MIYGFLMEMNWKLLTYGCKHLTLERQYVIIKTEANIPFGIYDPPGKEFEEAAIFQGQYITYNEFYDGYTLIDGILVDVKGAEYQVFTLCPEFRGIYFSW